MSDYNFEHIVSQLILYNNWKEQYLSIKSTKEKHAFKSKEPEKPRPKLYKEDLLKFDVQISNYRPVSGDNGFSVTETFKQIDDVNLKNYLKYCALEQARSDLTQAKATEATRHCPLVPIFLAAHKEYNGVNYNDWDRSDKFMRFAVGYRLYDSIEKWRKIPLSKELRDIARRNALITPKGKEVNPAVWPLHNIRIDKNNVLRPTDYFRHIWLQTWVANVENRNEFMILDVNDWDLMPEALDAVFKPQEIEMKMVDEMPF